MKRIPYPTICHHLLKSFNSEIINDIIQACVDASKFEMGSCRNASGFVSRRYQFFIYNNTSIRFYIFRHEQIAPTLQTIILNVICCKKYFVFLLKLHVSSERPNWQMINIISGDGFRPRCVLHCDYICQYDVNNYNKVYTVICGKCQYSNWRNLPTYTFHLFSRSLSFLNFITGHGPDRACWNPVWNRRNTISALIRNI